jgi:hypothetical protein
MISRVGQAMPRFLAGTSVAGDGMRERLQSATFAMFGVVTAIGLVLVGIAYNQTWPDFADSPIPGMPAERVGRATIAADAVHGQAKSGNGPASHGSAPAGHADVVPDRSSGPNGSPQQVPTPAPAAVGPGPAPSGQGGVDVPAPHAPAPAGQSPAAAPPAPVAAQPAPAPAPVAASPPAADPAGTASVPGNGKAKGHEKSEKPHGRPAPVTSVVPTPPSVPAPGAATPETSAPAAGPGNGNGNGNAKGHEK